MTSFETSKSKRQRALNICTNLLDDLDRERLAASTAVQRLYRIAHLINDDAIAEEARRQLDGYPMLGDTLAEVKRELKKRIEDGRLDENIDIEATANANLSTLPQYRTLHLKTTYGTGFKKVRMSESISKYEELLDRIRKDTKAQYTYHDDGVKVDLSAAELNKLVFGVKRWVYSEASKIEELLEFGQIPAAAMERTFEFVDAQMLELVPSAAERLMVAYRNLAERNQENWVNVADTCRRVIKDFADAVFPAQDENVKGLEVTEDKYLNRIRAFVRKTVGSRRQRQHMEAVLDVTAELLARTDNLASRSVHSGRLSRFEAERILIYTYLAIGDILILSGYKTRQDTVTERVDLNRASYEELQSKLGLSANVAAEIVKARKYRDFESWDDVAAVKGIGPKTIEKIHPLGSL